MSRSILTRLMWLIGLGLVLISSALTVYGLVSANTTLNRVLTQMDPVVRDAARARLESLALRTVAPLRGVFRAGDDTASALVSFGESVASSPAEVTSMVRRSLGMQMVKRALAAQPALQGAYITFEPNALDGDDANFAGQAELGSNETGRYAPYWSREEDGQLSSDDSTEDDIANTELQGDEPTNWWYQCPKTTRKPCLTSPYLDGDVLMVSTVRPMLADGRFIGQAGADIALSFLTAAVSQHNAEMYDGQGRLWLVSNRGAIAADSGGDTLMHKLSAEDKAFATLLDEALSTQKSQLQDDVAGHVVRFVTPFTVVEGGAPWAVAMAVPRNAVLADVMVLRQTLASARNKTLVGQLVVGAGILAVALVVLNLILRRVVKPVRRVAYMIRDVAEGDGDLTRHIAVESDDEIGLLARNMNLFVERLRELVVQIKAGASEVHQSSGASASGARRNAEQIQRQQLEIDQVATAVNEMSAAVQEISGSANRAADAASSASRAALDGRNVVKVSAEQTRAVAAEMAAVAEVIGTLESQSDQIARVLDVIRSIADQTNLLALNAAIEAARAGEAGRGFAVVADEVRTLAQRTQTSTVEIQQMVDGILSHTSAAVKAVHRGRERMDDGVRYSQEAERALVAITESVAVISDLNGQIATAVEEQSAVTDDLSRNITTIGGVASELADSAGSASRTANDLEQEARQLAQLVARFRT